MLGGRSWDEWISQYGQSHRHPLNRLCHTLGIPLSSFAAAFLVALVVDRFGCPVVLFVAGWVLQFVGTRSGVPPEFFHDWRFCSSGYAGGWRRSVAGLMRVAVIGNPSSAKSTLAQLSRRTR
jgi:uncharacterized membrane protein YGL010W